jgi:hypothetical protein
LQIPTTKEQIDSAISAFSRIYLGGIPPAITGDSAFHSFICLLVAVEAPAGYRHPDIDSPRERFRKFVGPYFPEPYDRFEIVWLITFPLFVPHDDAPPAQ